MRWSSSVIGGDGGIGGNGSTGGNVIGVVVGITIEKRNNLVSVISVCTHVMLLYSYLLEWMLYILWTLLRSLKTLFGALMVDGFVCVYCDHACFWWCFLVPATRPRQKQPHESYWLWMRTRMTSESISSLVTVSDKERNWGDKRLKWKMKDTSEIERQQESKKDTKKLWSQHTQKEEKNKIV